MSDFKKLKVVELRAELAARSLPQAGKRDELIERLEEYEFQNAQPAHDEETSNAPSNAASPQQESSELVEIEQIIEDASMSPVLPPTPVSMQLDLAEIERLAEIEEEKRRQRALRFGLDQSETAQVKIEVTLERLDHALPDRRRHFNRHRRSHHKSANHRQVTINKP